MKLSMLAHKLDSLVSRGEAILLAWSVIILTVLTVGNVISRKFFSYSWSFTEEISQLLLILVTFSGVGYAARQATHICMTAFFEVLPMRWKKALATVIALFTGLLLFYLAYYAGLYVYSSYVLQKMTPALRIPFYLFILAVPVGLGLGGLQYLLTFIKNLTTPGVWLSIDVTADSVEQTP